MSRHNLRQSRTTEKGNPNGISHVTMKKNVVYGLPIPLTPAASVHHNDVPLLKVIHDKDLIKSRRPSKESHP
jgi:hypothetical protein